MISLVFAAALLAGAADPATQAANTATAAATTPTKAAGKTDKNEMVCKREAVLGSRMKERVCLTQADWDQRKADSRADVEKSQSVKPLSF
ncbi:MAG: hypothetical protein KKE02_06285 [Alphaproteobacteria bacterium]|nr:hypothetical protein [Alphaproteobacteria bacterium]MBU1513124.1 hypothetical protein [Alphaproteobacteria bacterium]MBU2095232.1 hypothetical protein [Alphaproteobacteria bacterium]MBU2150609.1 hypothetical protein [Alphaproteobacteria bacterium]MBU2306132.1 hypothetical protein [Alphaproteobacteria bacterium]